MRWYPICKSASTCMMLSKYARCTSVGSVEGALDDRVGDLEELGNPTVGLTAHSGIVDVRMLSKPAARPRQAR